MTANAPSEAIETTITTLQEFINWCSDISIPAEHRNFYRGEANKEWSVDKETNTFLLTPAVYRNPEFRKNESQLYNELLSSDPAAFKDDSTLLDRLARMQHYGLPTRLLDITTNPLVALYFSCSDDTQEKQDGKVVLFHAPEHSINYTNTLPAASLSGIESILDFAGLFNAALQQYMNVLINGFNDVARYLNILLNSQPYMMVMSEKTTLNNFGSKFEAWDLKFHSNKDLNWDGSRFTLSSHMKGLKIFFNDFYDIMSSIEDHARECRMIPALEAQSIQLELASVKFENSLSEATGRIIDGLCARVGIRNERKYKSFLDFFMEFTSYRFIFPSIKNERLRRQHGVFLICPPYPAEPIVPVHSVIVPHTKKANLLKDLDKVGINSSQLFPELDVKARELKKRFGPKPDAVNTTASVDVE